MYSVLCMGLTNFVVGKFCSCCCECHKNTFKRRTYFIKESDPPSLHCAPTLVQPPFSGPPLRDRLHAKTIAALKGEKLNRTSEKGQRQKEKITKICIYFCARYFGVSVKYKPLTGAKNIKVSIYVRIVII